MSSVFNGLTDARWTHLADRKRSRPVEDPVARGGAAAPPGPAEQRTIRRTHVHFDSVGPRRGPRKRLASPIAVRGRGNRIAPERSRLQIRLEPIEVPQPDWIWPHPVPLPR